MAFWENFLALLGGLALFLFGMSLMGQGLEKRAGGRLQEWLSRLTSGRFRGLLLGVGVTALIQSSSAVTVMAVGFVNAGLLTLTQVTGIIMGANIGTTVTAWLLGLTQWNGSGVFFQMLKPSFFAPLLALPAVFFYLFSKKNNARSTCEILLGFSVLIFGMDHMARAVGPLSELPAFSEILLFFSNPILGILAGAVLTAVLQSSSASIGILQILAGAGRLPIGTAIPIVMGQNIGTCVTALLSSIGASRNAKRAAMIHLYFNLIGTVILITVFLVLRTLFDASFLKGNITSIGIAEMHTLFNLLCTLLLYPFASHLEALAARTFPDRKEGSLTLHGKAGEP